MGDDPKSLNWGFLRAKAVPGVSLLLQDHDPAEVETHLNLFYKYPANASSIKRWAPGSGN